MPLHAAVRYGHLDVVQQLVDAKADLEAKADGGAAGEWTELDSYAPAGV